MNILKDKINIAIVDDHKLFRKGIIELINGFENYNVLLEASDGKELTEDICSDLNIDIVLLDIKMKRMNGYETAFWLKENYPKIKILVLSMYDDDETIIKILKLGAKGYILKDSEPQELRTALNCLVEKGFYHSELVGNALYSKIHDNDSITILKENEVKFLQFACTELTYKEIADKMCISPRTIDNYRDDLFKKLHIKSRVGLVIYAIKNKIFEIDKSFPKLN